MAYSSSLSTLEGYKNLAPYQGLTLPEIEEKSCIINPYKSKRALDKGSVGRYLELVCGIQPSSNHTDFTDGDLKLFACQKSPNGLYKPKETMAITTELQAVRQGESTPFIDSRVYGKISKMVVVAFDKSHSYESSTLLDVSYVDLSDSKNTAMLDTLSQEYSRIESYLLKVCSDERLTLSTINGAESNKAVDSLLQIRTKDSKDKNGRYHPILSPSGRMISDKGRAFFFTKKALVEFLSLP